MEIELGLKITHTRDDATSSTEFRFAKDNAGPLFFSRETATMFILIAHLRGFKIENIEIRISEDGKQLTIGGKKPVQEITLQGWMMHKKDEIREFKKVFLIPDGVNLNRTKAKFNNEESTLRITMPKLVKGICGIEIQEVTEEHKERHEAAVPVDDQAHGKRPEIQRPEETEQVEQCEAEISEVAADQSLLKDRESLEEGAEPRIERKEKINDVVEKAVDTMPFEKDSQVEQGEVRSCESMAPGTVDKSSQTDGTSMEEVEATMMRKKEKTDHVADQELDAFQGDEHNNQLEQDEFQGDKQDQVEQAFDELQSDKHDQVDQRDASRSEPEAPPVVTDETSYKGGISVKEAAESVMENKMDGMIEQQHDEADQVQQSDVSRHELEIPQAMIDETTQKDEKSQEKDAESMMPSKLDQAVDKPQFDKADRVQPSEVIRYEPKMPQVMIDENLEGDISEAQPDKVKKKQLGKLEIPEAMIDETQQNDGKPLERGSGSMMARKEEIDQVEKHLNGENQFDKVDHAEQMEVSSNEPKVPQVMVGTASQKIENSQEDCAKLMTDSKEKKGDQSAEQVVDEKQYGKSSPKDSSSMEEVEAPTMRTQEKTEHVVDQAFAEIQGYEFPGEKQDQVGPSFDKFQIDKHDQMNQRDVTRREPEASPVVTDETSQKVDKSQEEDAKSMMERKKDQLVETQHDEANKVQRREVRRHELEIPRVIDETARKDVKSREQDARSMMPSKVDQRVDKPQHDESDQEKPSDVSRNEPEMPQAMIDEAVEKDIGEAQGDNVDTVQHGEVRRQELEMQEAMIDETVQEDGKPLEEGTESMMKRKEKIDQIDLVDHAEQSEVSRNEPEVSEDIVDEINRKEPDVPAAMFDVASEKTEKSYEDGTELTAESKEKKTDQVAEQVVDSQKHGKADHVEKCKDGMFLEEVAEPMMKSKKKIDWVEEHADGEQQSDKVDYAEHTEVRKYEPEETEAMVDAASQIKEKSHEESGELMTGSKEKKLDEVVEQVVDEHQYDKADHVEKRKISRSEYEMPAVPVDETSPEDGKYLQEAAETMDKSKKTIFQVVDKVFDEPQRDQMDHARQRAVSRYKPEMPPAIIDNNSGKDGKLQEAVMEFVKQVIDEPFSATDTNQVGKREVSRFKNEMPDVIVDETSLKDGKSLEKAEAIMKSKEKIDQVSEKVVEQDKAGGVDEVQPETESRKLIPEEKSKEPENKGSERSAEEKLSETEPKEMQAIAEIMPQTIASTQSEEATPEKKEPPASFLETISREPLETHQPGQEEVTNLEPEVARETVDIAPEKAKEFIQETTKQKLEKEERSEAFMEEPEKLVREKLHEKEFKGMEEPAQLVTQRATSMQLEENSLDADKHPVSSASYPETATPQVETSKTHHVERKDVSKRKPEVGKVLVDEQLGKDEESLDEITETKKKGKEGIDQVEQQWQLTEIEKAAETFAEMDGSKPITGEELEKLKLEMKEETEKAVEEKLDEGPKKIDRVPQTIVALQMEDDSPKRPKLPSVSALHPKITSDSDISESQYDGVKEATEQEPEVDRDAVEEAPKKEEEMFQEIRKPNIKIDKGSDQAVPYVVEEVPKKEDTFQEITKPKIKIKEESDQEIQHVADDLGIIEFEGPSAVSPGVDYRTLLSEESSGKSMLEMKEESGKKEENVDEEGSKTMEEAVGVVSEIITGVKLEEFHPGVKEYPVISPSYQETPRLGPDISDTRQDRQTEIGKWEPESIKLATDKMLQKDNLPPGQSADSQIKNENIRDQVAEAVLEDSSKMDIGQPTPERTSQIPKIEAFEETKRTVAENVDEEESKTVEDEILVTEAEPDASLTMQSEEASPEGEEHPTSLSSYPGSRDQEFDDSKGVRFIEKKVRAQDSELARFPAGDALAKDEELAEDISGLEMESKEEIDQAKEIIRVSPETDVSKTVPEKIDEEPEMEMNEETEKLADENADNGELKKKKDAADTVPQTIVPVKEEEATHIKEERHAIPEFCPTPGTSKSTASEIHQAKGKKVSEWEPKKTTAEAEEVSEKDDKSAKSRRKDQKESVHFMEHMIGDLQFKNVEAVTGDSHEMDDEELISEEKSEKSEIDTGEKTKGAFQEKIDEKVSDDIQDVPEVAPEVVASLKLEEATHQKDEPHARLDSYPETTEKPEAPETQLVSKEVSEWEPRTTETMAEGTPRTFEESSEEETIPRHAVDERKFKDLAEAVEVSPEMDSIKPMVEEKIRDSETEITEATTEKTTEKRAGEREMKELHGFTGEVPQTIESTKLDGAAPIKDKLPASTSYSDTKILDPEFSEHDRIGKQEIIVDAASDEVKRSLEETEKPKIDSKEERDNETGHVADEWQFKKVEDVTEVFPPLDSSQMMSEEKFEKPDTGIMEETEKAMDEKVDEGKSRKLQDVTKLVPEIPAITFQVEEPPLWEVTETSAVKSEKEIGQQQMTEPITQQSQREELPYLKQHEKQVLSAARSLVEEEAQQPKSIDLAGVTDQVTQPEEPNVTESQRMKGQTLPEPEKQEHEKSVEGIMRPPPDKVIEQVEAPVLTVEPQEDVSREHDNDHGVGDKCKTEKQEAIIEVPMKTDQGKEQIETAPRVAQIPEYADHQQDKDNGIRNEIEAEKLPPATPGTSVQKPTKPETDKENEQVETPMLADEPPRDEDHRQGSAAAPEKLDRGLSIEGQSKPPPDQEREQIERPLLADEFQSYGEHVPDKDHGLKHDIERPMKPEPGQEKEQVETPTLADELPRDGDQGQGSETTQEKQELGMSFEGYMKLVPDKEMEHVKAPLIADELRSDGDYIPKEDHGLENEIESEKRETEVSFEGATELKSDQEKERVEPPVLGDELPQGRDHGKGSETAPERQDIRMSFEGHMKPASDQEREQDETPFLADELPRDGDHGKRSETAAERQELGMNFEGRMKPASDHPRVTDETPFLADDPKNGRDHRKDEDSRKGNDSELDKKETELSTEELMKHEPDWEKEHVETPIPDDQPQRHGDHAQDDKQGRRSETTPEKQEVGMSFEECIESAAPEVETTLLGDKQGKDKDRGKAKVHELGKEIEELHDEVQIPEKKETEELESLETEMRKDFSLEQTSRKMDTVVPINCKLRSFLLFAGSTILLPLIMIVMKKSLIEFKSKKR